MLVKYVVPAMFELYGEKLEDEGLTAPFLFKNFSVSVHLTPEQEWSSFPIDGQLEQMITIDHLEILLDDYGDNSLAALVVPAKWEGLLRLLVETADHSISQIRNTGGVPHLHTVTTLGKEEPRSALHRLHAQVSENGATWREIVTKLDLSSAIESYLSHILAARPRGWLSTVGWKLVRTSLAQGTSPDASAQCMVNAQECLEFHDLRLAVLEVITGLELTLAQYLRTYCSRTRHMDKKQISRMLAPDITLQVRLQCLLPLCLGNRKLPDGALARVVKVVEWRNKIVHELGSLPATSDPEEVTSHIKEVMTIVEWLSLQVRGMETGSTLAHTKVS